MSTPLTDSINALTRYANETTGASDTTLSDAVESLVAGYGGGGSSSVQTVTGTIIGDGTNILEIPCAFAPDIIYIHTDFSDDVTKRGVVDFYLVKDRMYYIGRDSSSSNNNTYYEKVLITGYGDDPSQPHASYSNNILTINTVLNSSAARWLSGQTYTYELSAFGSSGGGNSCLWRTVTLEESHEADNIGNALYWGSFLDIASQTDLDEYTYVAVFTNNRPSDMTYCVNLISYVSVSGTIKCSSIRNDWSNTINQYNTGRSLWASVGAIINIYKLKTTS